MSYVNSIPINAGADLRSYQYQAVAIGGTLAVSGVACIGILQNKPKSGEDATAAYSGRSRYRCGGTITAGARLQVTSGGFLTVIASGGAQPMVGTALGAVSSGGIGEGIFNFATPANQ